MDIAALTLAAVERVEAVAVKVQTVVGTWIRRSNERRHLAMMNEHLLNDIGLSPYEVQKETAKFFWQQ
ncbi:MAG: DUF1127 domain-containing protein [Gammaproteobacteria bacterium]|nr:MAG: DUF1127 domain-containing protein [Gammaproteobacteria bacterium]UCH42032.1 MAG: DUF1127 domain-containing protein [Gammaproteobacteria bacterium]